MSSHLSYRRREAGEHSIFQRRSCGVVQWRRMGDGVWWLLGKHRRSGGLQTARFLRKQWVAVVHIFANFDNTVELRIIREPTLVFRYALALVPLTTDIDDHCQKSCQFECPGERGFVHGYTLPVKTILHKMWCARIRTFLLQIEQDLACKTSFCWEWSTVDRNPKAPGCNNPRAARALLRPEGF